MVACIRPSISSFGVFLPREDSLEKSVRTACFVAAVVPDSVAAVVCGSRASGSVGT